MDPTCVWQRSCATYSFFQSHHLGSQIARMSFERSIGLKRSFCRFPDLCIIDWDTWIFQRYEHKACGPDSIPNYILKHFANELALAITDIFYLSIKTGSLPSDWRNANISPVYKKGNKHIASNYRPVSLTSICCKTLEHIICKHILCHLEQHKILTSLQHGFRSGHSCESQLVITMHDLMQSFDRRLQTDMIILDFSKAFDTVPH